MAELKNQHFVPKAHLRVFSDDAGLERRMINMIHVASERQIKGASISGQCSKAYFYGKHLDLERAIGQTEGVYAKAVRQVEAGECSEALLQSLRTIIYFQYLRTDSARKRFRFFHEQLNEAIDDDRWTTKPTDDDLLTEALKSFFDTVSYVEDLRCILLENKTAVDFVTSDAPAVQFNKWLSQRHNISTFGLMSSGLCLYMPLTPRHAFLAYDRHVYAIDQSANRRMIVKDGAEVNLLNALIFRADASNVYFRDWESRDRLLSQVVEQKPFRTPSSKVTILVPIDETNSRFRALEDGEDPKAFSHSILHSEGLFPRPPKWFGFLKNKVRPVFFENGTAAGFVRKREWLKSSDNFSPPNIRKSSTLPGFPGNPFY